MNDQINTAGAPATKTAEKNDESALTRFLKEIQGQKVNETDKKKTIEAFKKLAANRAKAQEALDKAIEEEQKVSRDMIRCFGRGSFVIDGVTYSPSSREEKIFYKRSSSDIIVL